MVGVLLKMLQWLFPHVNWETKQYNYTISPVDWSSMSVNRDQIIFGFLKLISVSLLTKAIEIMENSNLFDKREVLPRNMFWIFINIPRKQFIRVFITNLWRIAEFLDRFYCIINFGQDVLWFWKLGASTWKTLMCVSVCVRVSVYLYVCVF